MSNDDLKWIYDKLEAMAVKQDKHTEIMARLVAHLDENARRTKEIELELKPIKAHVQLVNAGVKVLSACGALVMGAHSLGLF